MDAASHRGKAAIVTGGSSGIGRCVALRLARAGAAVAVVASNDIAKAEAVVGEIKANGGKGRAYAADVSSAAAASRLVEAVRAELGGVDILVNSAGLFMPTPVGDGDLGAFDRMVDTNLKGTFYCINAVAPIMKAAKGGTIVNIASVAGVLGVKGFAGYCATKAGVAMLTRALALELAPNDINVNAIAPGNTATPMNEAVRTDPANAGFLDLLRKATPSKRVFSAPEEIAELAYFLTTPAARAMHGSTLLIDEGLSAGI